MRAWFVRMGALALLSTIFVLPASAQNAPPAQPSGTISISQVQVAFIGSGALGGGTLTYRGRAYPFKLGGERRTTRWNQRLSEPTSRTCCRAHRAIYNGDNCAMVIHGFLPAF